MKLHTLPVIMVGAFPPPVHGMANVNAAVKSALETYGVTPITIDTSPSSLQRGLLSRLGRILVVIQGLFQFLFFSFRSKSMYLSVSGGLGRIYDLCFLIVARVSQMKIYLHHHSYSYLHHADFISKLMFYVAGGAATHLVLGQCMKADMELHYPMVKKCIPISNAVFLNDLRKGQFRTKERVICIGFIGNISIAKGIDDFLTTCEKFNDCNSDMKFLIAGPFEDELIHDMVMDKVNGLRNTDYIGPKYDHEKEDFYNEIDLLLFPTNYINEAEPLTILEALSNAVPVISKSRGCISGMISDKSGRVTFTEECFSDVVVSMTEVWNSTPDLYAEVSISARHQYEALKEGSLENLCQLLNDLSGISDEKDVNND